MRIAKEQLKARIDIPGAKARQVPGFGDASGYKGMAGEYFSLAAGTDIAPLLKGLENDHCQAPHWGYMISGKLVVTYTNGTTDACSGNDLFYWPPGHSVKVIEDAEVILFSPEHEHNHVIDHMLNAMKG